MQRFWSLLGFDGSPHARRDKQRSRQRTSRPGAGRRPQFETLERREVMTASPLPVLLVIADSHHYYYQEYGDTRASLEAADVEVVVAARTTNPSTPHPGTGEPWGGFQVNPDIALADVNADDYSAIAFVGGWGSSMYQYAFPGDYNYDHYDGDPATKAVVNDLIGDFIEQDKYIAAVCHGTMVLAWARYDGLSPLHGKNVSIPWIGSPAVEYEGVEYGDFGLMQYEQAVANGAFPNAVPGQVGDPSTDTDDVTVDGRVVTAENQNTAAYFGERLAELVWAEVEAEVPLNNTAPMIADDAFMVNENSPAGTVVGTVMASDADVGQTLMYAITAGNEAGAFSIDAATGQISVADATALNFEISPVFNLTVEATDDGLPALSASAVVTVSLLDVFEGPIAMANGDLCVQGTDGGDTIYIWTDAGGMAFAWLNGLQSGPHALGPSGRVIVFSGDGDDRVYASDSMAPVTLHGEGGHDLMTGGHADDILDGGDGVDRIWGGGGNDVLLGGAGDDILDGREGDDLVIGGAGNDQLAGHTGQDVLLGGLGVDRLDGGVGEDLLIGGATDYDANAAALLAILDEWRSAAPMSDRMASLKTGLPGGIALTLGGTVHDDGAIDSLLGGADADWVFASMFDKLYSLTAADTVTS